jgi:AmpE protein
MALFSLLIAILVERLKLLPAKWQLDSLLQRYHLALFGDKQLASEFMMGLALLLPALCLYALGWVVTGVLWGAVSLGLWVLVAILCFCHQQQRRLFKQYIKAACRGDVQACYHYGGELDSHACLDAVSAQDLGARVGESVAWLNYRFYGAVALMLIFFGPTGALFYCTVRFYTDENQRGVHEWPLVDAMLTLLDWLPSRLFAFGYLLCGDFSQALAQWRRLALNIQTSARRIITQTAVAAEVMPEPTDAPVCVQSTLTLLALSKRNFILLVTALSLLTIFGVVS